MGRRGPYQLQASIAAVHDEVPTATATDWAQILGLYEVLARLAPSPVVALNRAVALAQVAGPAMGLAAMDELAGDPGMAWYRFFHAARADLLRRLGRDAEAAAAYDRALALAPNGPERTFLEERRREVAVRGSAG
jgi:RNA polymerase sigma-70 factor (ECF subfamily)